MNEKTTTTEDQLEQETLGWLRDVGYVHAWHFAFLDTPTMAIPSEDGDIGANPPGFDRSAFLGQLQRELPAFLTRH